MLAFQVTLTRCSHLEAACSIGLGVASHLRQNCSFGFSMLVAAELGCHQSLSHPESQVGIGKRDLGVLYLLMDF